MIKGLTLLATLHPSMADAARYALDEFDRRGLQPVVTECYRDLQTQAKYYAQGRTTPGEIITKAKPGESAHNFGLALDVTSVKGYESAEQREIHRLFGTFGFITISWDLPHAEHPAWPSILRELRRTYPGFYAGNA